MQKEGRKNDYKVMDKTIKSASQVEWPSAEIVENFKFSAVDDDGVFIFEFKFFNGRWNLWVTLPDGSTRPAGVYPNVISWSGFLDYGIVFITELNEIDFNHLNMTELYIIKWA